MTTKAYIAFRLIVPPLIYIPVGLLFAMVTLPFKAHFGAHYTYAGGFFLWAFTVWLGMCALGLALEFAITLLGTRFMGYFLVSIIIANVSCGFLKTRAQDKADTSQSRIPPARAAAVDIQVQHRNAILQRRAHSPHPHLRHQERDRAEPRDPARLGRV